MITKTQGWIGVSAQQSEAQQQGARIRQFVEQGRADALWDLPPKELARQLQEADPWVVQQLLGLSGWEVLTGYAASSSLERELAIASSRRMYKTNPLHQWSIWLWTSWGLGDSIDVSIVRKIPQETDGVAATWDEFFTATRNQAVFGDDCIQELSNWLLIDGNSFLAFYASNQDGETMVSELNPDEITEIVAHPQNAKRPLFYKRQFTSDTKSSTWYYPDWQAYFSGALDKLYPGDKDGRTLAEVVLPHGAIRADTQRKVDDHSDDLGGNGIPLPHTAVCILHVAHNHKERGNLWGWSLSTCSRPFLEAHKKFVESRLTIAMAKAAFVRRMTTKGGSRAVKGLVGTVASNLDIGRYTDTNPPAPAGSTQMTNDAVTVEDLPMSTGAGDAHTDNQLFTWLPLLGEGLFPTSAGLDTARWATAVEMDRAQSMLFERYQTFWRAQFERMVKIAVGFKEKFGNLTPGDYTVEVSVDSFSLADFPAVGKAIGDVVSRTLTPAVKAGVLTPDAARAILAPLWRIILQSLGIKAATQLTDEEAFGTEVAALPPVGETAVEKIAAELGCAMAAGDAKLSEALTWAIETAVEELR